MADEMGLGKTIQSIGFIRCLTVEMTKKKVRRILLLLLLLLRDRNGRHSWVSLSVDCWFG